MRPSAGACGGYPFDPWHPMRKVNDGAESPRPISRQPESGVASDSPSEGKYVCLAVQFHLDLFRLNRHEANVADSLAEI